MELKYEEVFNNFLWTMQLNLLHPETKRDKTWTLHFYLKHGIITTVFILIMYNIIFLNLRDSDFSQTCKNGTLSVVFLATEFQHCIILWKEQYLLDLMNNMKKDYALAKQFSVNEREVIEEYAKRAANIYKYWMYVCWMILGSFPFVNAILITYYWVNGEFRLIPLYDLVYPAFIENKKDSLLVFGFTYIVLLSYGASSAIMTMSFVPLGPSFMLHACGQMEVLKIRILALFKNDNIEEVREKIKQIVKQMQYIYSFVDQINISFSIAYEVTLKAATVMLPITCFEVVESLKHRELSLEFIMFIIGGVGLNSILCFYSDVLEVKNEDFRQAVYSCGWEKVYDREVRSTLRIILLRTYQPMAIRTLFSTVCLNTLTALFNQSYTIFNLMNAAWN